jgi:hypothetical protein
VKVFGAESKGAWSESFAVDHIGSLEKCTLFVYLSVMFSKGAPTLVESTGISYLRKAGSQVGEDAGINEEGWCSSPVNFSCSLFFCVVTDVRRVPRDCSDCCFWACQTDEDWFALFPVFFGCILIMHNFSNTETSLVLYNCSSTILCFAGLRSLKHDVHEVILTHLPFEAPCGVYFQITRWRWEVSAPFIGVQRIAVC